VLRSDLAWSHGRIEDPYRFLDLAFVYYTTDRFAAINQLNIAPNLMHHAIELLIKLAEYKQVTVHLPKHISKAQPTAVKE